MRTQSRDIAGVVVVGDRFPQLLVRVVQIDPVAVPVLMVGIDDPARVAVARRFARDAMDVIHSPSRALPICPTKASESPAASDSHRENRAVLVEMRERQDLAIAKEVAGIDRGAAVEAIGLGVVVAPVETEDRRTTGSAGQAQRAAQRRHEDEGIRERVLFLIDEEQVERSGVTRLLGRSLPSATRCTRCRGIVRSLCREAWVGVEVAPAIDNIDGGRVGSCRSGRSTRSRHSYSGCSRKLPGRTPRTRWPGSSSPCSVPADSGRACRRDSCAARNGRWAELPLGSGDQYFSVRLNPGLRQEDHEPPGRLDLGVRRHLPVILALEQLLHAQRHELLVLLPVRHRDLGADRSAP